MITSRSVTDVVRVMDRIDEHVAAELTSDPTTIMSTISAEPFFPVLVRDGHGRAALSLLMDTETVASFYGERVGIFEILDTTRVTEIRTDWYALHESAATVRHVGEYLGAPPTGDDHEVHSVVLFPTDRDGIVGELEWTRVDFSRIFRGGFVDPPSTAGADRVAPVARLQAARTHDELLTAWLHGGVDELSSILGDAPWAGRHVHRDDVLTPLVVREAGAEMTPLTTTFAPTAQLLHHRRLQRYATDWFSFVEIALDIDLENDPRTIRLASLLAFEQGRPTGHLVYSVDVET